MSSDTSENFFNDTSDDFKKNIENEIKQMTNKDLKKDYLRCRIEMQENFLNQSLMSMKHEYEKLEKKLEAVEKKNKNLNLNIRQKNHEINNLDNHISWVYRKISSSCDFLWIIQNMLRRNIRDNERETIYEESCRVQISSVLSLLNFVRSTDQYETEILLENFFEMPDCRDEERFEVIGT